MAKTLRDYRFMGNTFNRLETQGAGELWSTWKGFLINSQLAEFVLNRSVGLRTGTPFSKKNLESCLNFYAPSISPNTTEIIIIIIKRTIISMFTGAQRNNIWKKWWKIQFTINLQSRLLHTCIEAWLYTSGPSSNRQVLQRAKRTCYC